MEVHAHTHTPRKKWTHYFWEFLMLFLAVFCGFLAEYQLEHKIEKEKGKQYIVSLREDLCKDTAILHNTMIGLQKNLQSLDTITHLIKQGRINTPADIKLLYEHNLPALGGFGVTLTDRTAAQLKNSGGMRLITRKKVADKILEYWSNEEVEKGIQSNIQLMRTQAREKTYRIFDNKYYADSSINGKRAVTDNAVLMTTDYNELAELSNRMEHIKRLLNGTYMDYLKKLKTGADSLIIAIDTEYHLK